MNPTAAVRGPKHVVTKGATPAETRSASRRSTRALWPGSGTGRYSRLRLHEKGGKRHDVPAHQRAAAALDAYVEAGELEEPKADALPDGGPGGPAADEAGRSNRRLVQATIKRRAAASGLPPQTCHTYRATGITAYLSNGGTLERAQQIAGHASPKTTKLYDRTADTVTVDEIERIVI